MEISSFSRLERSAMIPPKNEKRRLGKPKARMTRPNCEEELVMSNTSQPRIRNCIPWAMTWLTPFS